MVNAFLAFVVIDIAVFLFLAILFSNRSQRDFSFSEATTLYVVSFFVAGAVILYWVYTSL